MQDFVNLSNRLSYYCYAQPKRAVWELSLTMLSFTFFWLLALVGVAFFNTWFVIFSLPAGVFLVRLFMIQHDCGHGSFFRHRLSNDIVGRAIGILTWTPYAYWRRLHAQHHATSGNLDQRGKGDIDTLTVKEYRNLDVGGRFIYRLYRNPIVLFGIGPAYLFVFKQRLPIELFREFRDGWVSVMATNFAIIVVGIIASLTFGIWAFATVQVPIIMCAATIGVWLFYVQHQFGGTQWASGNSWQFHRQALEGSSFYDLPTPLRWLTANIGIHHVHHLRSRIPFYRLNDCLRDFPELRSINRLTFYSSLRCATLVLWDEGQRKLLSFRSLRKMVSSNASR